MAQANLIQTFIDPLLAIDRLKVKEIITKARETWTAVQIVDKMIVPTMEKIGLDWEQGRLALSQIYMSGRICEEIIETILPLKDFSINKQSKMAIAVLEDHHMLGKRIVYSILRASRFELYDYGSVEVDDLVRLVQDNDIQILLVSTLMLHSALKVRELTTKIRKTNSDIKIVVGGAPFRFDQELWKEVEADGMGKNASEAVSIVKNFLGEGT